MATHYGNQYERSMNGITSLDTQNINSNDIVCDNLSIQVQGTTIEPPTSEDSNVIPTTSWVNDKISTATNIDLQDAYDNSTDGKITIASQSLKFKANASITNLLEFQNSSGTSNLIIDKDGNLKLGNNSLNIGYNLSGFNVINIGATAKPLTIGATGVLATANDIYAGGSLLTNDLKFNDPDDDLEIGGNQTGTGRVKFITNPPECSITATSGNQLVNKDYIDNHPHDNILASNNVFTGTNDFSNTISAGTINAYNSGDIHLGANQWTGDTLRLGNSASSIRTAGEHTFENNIIAQTNIYGGNIFGTNFQANNTANNLIFGNNLTTGDANIGSTNASSATNIQGGGGISVKNDTIFDGYIHSNTIRGKVAGGVTIDLGTANTANIGGNVDTITVATATAAYPTTSSNSNLKGTFVQLGLANGSTNFTQTIKGSCIDEIEFEAGSFEVETGSFEVETDGFIARSHLAGVYLVNNNSAASKFYPIFYSIGNYANFTQQNNTGGTTNLSSQSGTLVGTWKGMSLPNIDNNYLLMPNWGIIVYQNTFYGGTIRLNVKNDTANPVQVATSTIDDGQSCKVYFNDVEITKK